MEPTSGPGERFVSSMISLPCIEQGLEHLLRSFGAAQVLHIVVEGCKAVFPGLQIRPGRAGNQGR